MVSVPHTIDSALDAGEYELAALLLVAGSLRIIRQLLDARGGIDGIDEVDQLFDLIDPAALRRVLENKTVYDFLEGAPAWDLSPLL